MSDVPPGDRPPEWPPPGDPAWPPPPPSAPPGAGAGAGPTPPPDYGTLPGAGPYGYGQPRPAGGPSGPRAGFWIRFVAALVDGLLVGLINQIVGAVVGPIPGIAFGILAGFAYYGFFEGGPSGQTVGKKALNIRVVRFADGGPLGWSTALLRHLTSYLSGLACLLGYFWMLWDPERQTWHDKLTSTVVVPADAWPPPPGSFGKAPEF